MISNDFIGDLNDYSSRKLMYMCHQLKIPLPLNPSRNTIINSIKSYYSDKNKGPQTPNGKTKPCAQSCSNIFETPKVPTTDETTSANALPTPIYFNRSMPYQSAYSRQPSPAPAQKVISPIISALAEKQREANQKNQQKKHFRTFLFIAIVICLLLLLLFVIYHL